MVVMAFRHYYGTQERKGGGETGRRWSWKVALACLWTPEVGAAFGALLNQVLREAETYLVSGLGVNPIVAHEFAGDLILWQSYIPD